MREEPRQAGLRPALAMRRQVEIERDRQQHSFDFAFRPPCQRRAKPGLPRLLESGERAQSVDRIRVIREIRGRNILARDERTGRRLESPRARETHVERRWRAAPGLGAGLARGARVVQRQACRARHHAGDRCRRQQLGDAQGRVRSNRHHRQPPRFGAERRMARRRARRDGGPRSAADVQGPAAAGHDQGRRLGRRRRRAVRAKPARLVGRRRQPPGRGSRTPRRQDRREAGRCAPRERRRAVAHARIAAIPEGDQREGLSRAAHRTGTGARIDEQVRRASS